MEHVSTLVKQDSGMSYTGNGHTSFQYRPVVLHSEWTPKIGRQQLYVKKRSLALRLLVIDTPHRSRIVTLRLIHTPPLRKLVAHDGDFVGHQDLASSPIVDSNDMVVLHHALFAVRIEARVGDGRRCPTVSDHCHGIGLTAPPGELVGLTFRSATTGAEERAKHAKKWATKHG
jgi:hypothetical protein